MNKKRDQLKNKYQKRKNKERKNHRLSSYGPSEINPNRRSRMELYGQQQEKEHIEELCFGKIYTDKIYTSVAWLMLPQKKRYWLYWV